MSLNAINALSAASSLARPFPAWDPGGVAHAFDAPFLLAQHTPGARPSLDALLERNQMADDQMIDWTPSWAVCCPCLLAATACQPPPDSHRPTATA